MKLKRIIIIFLVISIFLSTKVNATNWWANSVSWNNDDTSGLDYNLKYCLRMNGDKDYENVQYNIPSSSKEEKSTTISYEEDMYILVTVSGVNNTTSTEEAVNSKNFDSFTYKFYLYDTLTDKGNIEKNSCKVTFSGNSQDKKTSEMLEAFKEKINNKDIELPSNFVTLIGCKNEEKLKLTYKTTATIKITYTGKKYKTTITYDRKYQSYNKENQGNNRYYDLNELEKMTAEDPSLDEDLMREQDNYNERKDAYDSQFKEGTEEITGPSQVNYTGDTTGSAVTDPVEDPDAYGTKIGEIGSNDKVVNIAVTIISAIRTIGIALSVVMLTYIRIQIYDGKCPRKGRI